MHCLLCSSPHTTPFFQRNDVTFGKKFYWQCTTCSLIFLVPECRLSSDEEKKRYDLHQNNPEDEGYVQFLKQVTVPLKQILHPQSKGLDFGCGHTPVLSGILKKEGHTMENYDPIYFPNKNLRTQYYDFITCTEVIEHFYTPRNEFILFNKLLKPQNSFLAIMTALYNPNQNFNEWWYPKDPTHICFYQKETIEWLADWMGLEIVVMSDRICILKTIIR
ncbi:Putative methyltransferase associated with DUF414 [hydrothermal vent metagenome]|uniref:Methyltransferase associated with DUF414 n=1 Tax=hydrothermal vent metagenome TaxID=652676 RepID=A0A3B1DBN6_9ZZZZ